MRGLAHVQGVTAMPTPGSTTARGYGYEHQKARRAHLAALREREAAGVETLCARGCGQPVRTGQHLDLDHTDDRSGYRGLAHRSCNRGAGAIKGSANRRLTRAFTGRW